MILQVDCTKTSGGFGSWQLGRGGLGARGLGGARGVGRGMFGGWAGGVSQRLEGGCLEDGLPGLGYVVRIWQIFLQPK